VDFEKIKALGLPFWLAGSWGCPDKLKEALSIGAQGIQVGTAFAFSKESGFSKSVKEKAIKLILKKEAKVFTDPLASPTGFPFKVLSLEGDLSQPEEYKRRPRICDLGYLRHIYKKSNGSVGYRCPAEPAEMYIKKGGRPEDLEGRKCLCNSLLANLGLGQRRKDGSVEKDLVTIGDDILSIGRFLKNRTSYTAQDVIDWLLKGVSRQSMP